MSVSGIDAAAISAFNTGSFLQGFLDKRQVFEGPTLTPGQILDF